MRKLFDFLERYNHGLFSHFSCDISFNTIITPDNQEKLTKINEAPNLRTSKKFWCFETSKWRCA